MRANEYYRSFVGLWLPVEGVVWFMGSRCVWLGFYSVVFSFTIRDRTLGEIPRKELLGKASL